MSSKEYQVWIVAMLGQWRREKLVISAVRKLNGFIGEGPRFVPARKET